MCFFLLFLPLSKLLRRAQRFLNDLRQNATTNNKQIFENELKMLNWICNLSKLHCQCFRHVLPVFSPRHWLLVHGHLISVLVLFFVFFIVQIYEVEKTSFVILPLHCIPIFKFFCSSMQCCFTFFPLFWTDIIMNTKLHKKNCTFKRKCLHCLF